MFKTCGAVHAAGILTLANLMKPKYLSFSHVLLHVFFGVPLISSYGPRPHARKLWSVPRARCKSTRTSTWFIEGLRMWMWRMLKRDVMSCSKNLAMLFQSRPPTFFWGRQEGFPSSQWSSWVSGPSGCLTLAAFGGSFVAAQPMKPWSLFYKNFGFGLRNYTLDMISFRLALVGNGSQSLFHTFLTKMKVVVTSIKLFGSWVAMGA